MRIPHTIYSNTTTAYKIPPHTYLRRELLKADDFVWNESFIPSLRELSLVTISKNWEKNPIYKTMQFPADKCRLVELLYTDLPLKLTIPILTDDYYWERCYFDRWQDSPPPVRNMQVDKNIDFDKFFEELNRKEEENANDNENKVNISVIRKPSPDLREKCIKIINYENMTEQSCDSDESGNKENKSAKMMCDAVQEELVIPVKSWKQCYLERYMEEELERMGPDMFNPEYIKDLTDLCGEYIMTLNLKELKCCKNTESTDHISLHSLLARLPNLVEFSVCFNQAHLHDNFSWHAMQVSESDCDLLGKGVEKSKMKILRIVQSNIDATRLKLIIRNLVAHKTLQVLDLSYCKIADEGALALAGLLEENRLIHTVNLVNNKIGPKGAQGIAYHLCEEKCSLVSLNLKMNPLEVEGGKYLATALVRGAKNLSFLSLSACGLTHENIHIGNALALNTTLQKLDLSNNHLGEDTGTCILEGLTKNNALFHLDVRMCDMPPNMVQEIEATVRKNLTAARGILKTVPNIVNIRM